MLCRFQISALLLGALTLPFIGCAASQVDSIHVSPAAQSLQVGQTAQFSATGTTTHGKHPATTDDLTSMVTWTSSASAVATVSASGLATAVSAGTTTITASMKGFTGSLSSSAVITVTGSGGSTGNSDILSISVIPGAQAVAAPSSTSQFIAIGATSSGATQDLTRQVLWTSSSSQIATISGSGLATAINQGTATISAIFTNPDKSVATGTATFTVLAGSSQPITAIAITPGSESLSASGQVGQFIAIGTSGATGLHVDLTNSPNLQWISSIPSVASVTSGLASGNGIVKGASAGNTTISAIWTNPDGSVVSAPPSTVTVSLTTAPNPLLSLNIIPGALSVGNLQDTGQFILIGTFSTPPYVRDLTNAPGTTWLSSFPDSFPVNTNSGGTSSATAGIVTAYASGSATIIAEYTNPDPTNPTIDTATATFSCPLVLPNPPTTAGSCYQGKFGPLKTTLTVYGEGLNSTNWLVTGPSATGTADVIHCGPGWAANGGAGGSVCVGIYPIGTTVTLTAPAQKGVAFGGWTNYCAPVLPVTATGPNSCQITLGSTNATVGAIFNNTP